MADAAHHRVMGAAETANAWLSVLLGSKLPSRPAFPRTNCKRQASSHRVMLILLDAQPGDPNGSFPCALANLGLAAVLVPDAGALPVEQLATLVADPW